MPSRGRYRSCKASNIVLSSYRQDERKISLSAYTVKKEKKREKEAEEGKKRETPQIQTESDEDSGAFVALSRPFLPSLQPAWALTLDEETQVRHADVRRDLQVGQALSPIRTSASRWAHQEAARIRGRPASAHKTERHRFVHPGCLRDRRRLRLHDDRIDGAGRQGRGDRGCAGPRVLPCREAPRGKEPRKGEVHQLGHGGGDASQPACPRPRKGAP